MGKKVLIRDASEILGLSQNALRIGIKNGMIPYFMVGNRYILDVELIEKVLEDTSMKNMLFNQNNDGKHAVRRILE